jgi:hypothetical protein
VNIPSPYEGNNHAARLECPALAPVDISVLCYFYEMEVEVVLRKCAFLRRREKLTEIDISVISRKQLAHRSTRPEDDGLLLCLEGDTVSDQN